MTDEIKPENITACFLCFATKNLVLMPYKYEGKFVGCLFFCKKCHPKIQDNKMRIILEEDEGGKNG